MKLAELEIGQLYWRVSCDFLIDVMWVRYLGPGETDYPDEDYEVAEVVDTTPEPCDEDEDDCFEIDPVSLYRTAREAIQAELDKPDQRRARLLALLAEHATEGDDGR